MFAINNKATPMTNWEWDASVGLITLSLAAFEEGV
jgi:hypothetical protein